MTQTCIMCAAPLKPRKGVKQAFCTSSCRKQFHDGCRRIGQELYRKGAVTIEHIREAARTN